MTVSMREIMQIVEEAVDGKSFLDQINPSGRWFHGSADSEFKIGAAGTGRNGAEFGQAFYVTNNPDYADKFTGSRGHIVPVLLSPEINPLVPWSPGHEQTNRLYGEQVKKYALSNGFNAVIGRIGQGTYQLAIYDPKFVHFAISDHDLTESDMRSIMRIVEGASKKPPRPAPETKEADGRIEITNYVLKKRLSEHDLPIFLMKEDGIWFVYAVSKREGSVRVGIMADNPDELLRGVQKYSDYRPVGVNITPTKQNPVYHGTTLQDWKRSGASAGHMLYVTNDPEEAEGFIRGDGTEIVVEFSLDDLLALAKRDPDVELQPDWGWVGSSKPVPSWQESLEAVGNICINGFKDVYKKLGTIHKV